RSPRRGAPPPVVSLEHPVGLLEQRRGNRQGERAGGSEIDDELEARRARHRKLRRPGASQDAIDEPGGLTEDVGPDRAVREKASGVDESAEREDRRQPDPARERRDRFPARERELVGKHDDAMRSLGLNLGYDFPK